jgi:HlyD family secretion protein
LLQIDNQVSGISGQISAIEEQIASLTKDITKQTRLVDQGLARQSQLGDLTRNMAVLEGQYAQLTAERARLINSRQDRRLETEQAERAFLEQVVTDLRTTSGQVDELTLEIVTRMEQLDRVDIRAPSEGIVHEIQVTTTGGVLAPGATLMQVIPLDQGMDFELRLDPRSVDDIQPGQAARIVLSAFDAQTTPKLAGKVTMISPGAVVDPQTGQSFYRVEIGVSADELAKLGTLTLIPGMPVEAYLETRSRSVLDYLMEPITHHLQRALREH